MSGGGSDDDLARWVDGLVEGRRGWCAQRKRHREVYGFPARGPETHWIKRGRGPLRAEIRREAVSARLLASMGLGPAVLASGAFRGDEWIVEAQATGLQLSTYNPVPPGRRSHLAAIAAAFRRLHEAGIACPDFTASHTFFSDRGVHFIDAARMTVRGGAVPRAARARDLAAFLFSLSWARILRVERVRFLREATGESGDGLRELCHLVDRRVAALALRTRWRHDHVDLPGPAVLEGPGYGEHLFRLQRERRPEARSFHALSAIRDSALTDHVRTLPDRENRTLGRGPDGRPLFFVKVFPPTKSGWSPAMREVAAIDLFQRKGILVNRLAAYAEDVDKGSLVAVKACAGEPLDDLLRRGDAAAVTVAERRALAVQTARIWRRMRECGLRHRDAYPCHVFAARTETPLRFELRLIDMTRAGEAPWPRERWFVKDAAQLWHGARPAGATRTDAVRWLREYFRVPKLTREAKRFARKVAAKERSIAARQERKARRAGTAR